MGGDFMRYKFNPKKQSRHIHIADDNGNTLCKLENGSGGKKLTRISQVAPSGRPICSICSRLAAVPVIPKKSHTETHRFYSSYDWAKLRYEALIHYGRKCLVCGNSENLTVDHIKPVRFYPELALELTNLQVLCRLCNRGKGNWDETDWRVRWKIKT